MLICKGVSRFHLLHLICDILIRWILLLVLKYWMSKSSTHKQNFVFLVLGGFIIYLGVIYLASCHITWDVKITYFMYHGVRKYWSRFHWILVRFRFQFEAGSASKPYQKPVLFCGMVLVWFWFGFGLVLVWFGAEPQPYQPENIQNGYVYSRTHVLIMSTMVLYAIFLNWILAETDFRRNCSGMVGW